MSNYAISTAGAVPVRNEKGEISMEKVKVQRYTSGKIPKYAENYYTDSSESIDEEKPPKPIVSIVNTEIQIPEELQKTDRRLQRLNRVRDIDQPSTLRARNRSDDSDNEKDNEQNNQDEDNIELRHSLLRQKIASAEGVYAIDPDNLECNESQNEEDEEEEDDYEDEYEDDSDDNRVRLKPVFISRKDVKIKNEVEQESRKIEEDRRREALRLIEQEMRRTETYETNDNEVSVETINSSATDDECDEVAFMNWKVRELKRIKRDKEEREAITKERREVERFRSLTEEQKQAELRRNPKVVINKPEQKGKYRFLQRYYHRGAFFMDKEEDLYKRDASNPTLDDHFDKSVLPKVMQVKNFGRSGRTKYTHLVDQDTTSLDSPWQQQNSQTSKFYQQHGGGMKQTLERPSKKRK